MFKYKTKGMSSPQGKQRVYFSCHPKDYDIFFENISDEILNNTDCAIWYNTDEVYEDIDTDLGQMNLFVIPITTKLLTEPNRTIEIDVPFALEKHIPILPLMQESGLDELFSKYFGDLQYLDPNSRDETAISYEKKLDKYLKSVLIGDELAEKVRAAFDAYIFLSYRKKDRKYANELMRLIHKNDICRDIAIWYDEFLVPGENFNQAISDALQKSELFTLVVTPNLVNEMNYVQTVEYPEAVKQNKTILPAELEKTDYNTLSEKYPGIPNGVDARNGVALSSALEAALVSIARKENDNDPLHNFFIGLAYLDGIDVEIDNERALSLITSAAEAEENKVPEAIEKLVSMYKDGHGVERDYYIAVKWQEKLVEYLENEYNKSHNINIYSILYSALLVLGDQLFDLGKIDAAEKSYMSMFSLTEQLTEEIENVDTKLDLSLSYRKLGDICKARENLDGAEDNYLKATAIDEQLTENNETVDARQNLAISYSNLGEICKARGNLHGAEEHYLKVIAISEQIVEETESVDARRNLAIFYGRLAHLYEEFSNKDKAYLHQISFISSFSKEKVHSYQDYAEEYYKKEFTLNKQLLEETGTVDERRNLAMSYVSLGDIYKLNRKLDFAEDYYLKAVDINEQIVEEIGTVTAKRNLAINYGRLSNLYNECDELDVAEVFYEKDINISEQLADETETVLERKKLSICYSDFGVFYENQDDLKKAEEYYQKSLILRKQLAEETKTIEEYDNLASIYMKIALLRKPYKWKLIDKAMMIYNILAVRRIKGMINNSIMNIKKRLVKKLKKD